MSEFAPYDRSSQAALSVAERVERLRPWATIGWDGYERGVYIWLLDAANSHRQGSDDDVDYCLTNAERYAESRGLDFPTHPYLTEEEVERQWKARERQGGPYMFRWPESKEN